MSEGNDGVAWLQVFGITEGYITGLGRSYPEPRLAHIYQGPYGDPGLPMCRYGWNRGGEYSIWRNNVGRDGICRICLKRVRAGLDGVEPVTDELQESYSK